MDLLSSERDARGNAKDDSDLEDDEIKSLYNKLNFKLQHTKYREFLGKYDDDEFFIDEDLPIFFPPMRSM
jgi:hypothetical protein